MQKADRRNNRLFLYNQMPEFCLYLFDKKLYEDLILGKLNLMLLIRRKREQFTIFCKNYIELHQTAVYYIIYIICLYKI